MKFNFDRIVDPKFKAGGARAALAGYAGSKVLDEFTVQVSFETPYAPFLNYAAAGTAQPRLAQGGARDAATRYTRGRSAPGRS